MSTNESKSETLEEMVLSRRGPVNMTEIKAETRQELATSREVRSLGVTTDVVF